MKDIEKKTLVLVALLSLISYSANTFAVNYSGKVTRITFHLNNWQSLDYNQEGQAQIYIEGLPNACGTGDGRVAISSRNPVYNSVVSAALAAQARGVNVNVEYLNSCSVRSNSWDLVIFQSLDK